MDSIAEIVYDAQFVRGDPEFEEETTEEILHYLNAYPDDLLRGLKVMFESASTPSWQAGTLAEIIGDGALENQVRGYMHFAPLLVCPNGNPPWNPASIVESFRDYPELKDRIDNNDYMDERTTLQCAALINTVIAIIEEVHNSKRISVSYRYDSGHSYIPIPYITDTRLARLLLDRPEDAPRIADIITDRRTDDYGIIRRLLTEATGALSRGAL